MGRLHDGKSIWHIVKDCAKGIGMPKLAPHDLRRTCARLCHASGGELEQIQFLLRRNPRSRNANARTGHR
jgi:integrase